MYFQLARPNADIARFSWVGRWIWALGVGSDGRLAALVWFGQRWRRKCMILVTFPIVNEISNLRDLCVAVSPGAHTMSVLCAVSSNF